MYFFASRFGRPVSDPTLRSTREFLRSEKLRDSRKCANIMNRKLTLNEVTMALGALPPILIPEEAAALLRIQVSTLYRHVSEGRYGGAVKRGKPLRFWRDRLVQEFMR